MEIDFPLESPDYVVDPHKTWKLLRENDPIHWVDKYNFWVVTKYDDLAEMAKLTTEFSSKIGPSGGIQETDYLPMIQDDPPDHTRLRSLVSRTFSPRRIETLETDIQAISDALVSQIHDVASSGDEFDFYQLYASPLPVKVIALLLGVPEEFHERLRVWAEATGIGSGEQYTPDQQITAMKEIGECLEEVIEQRRANPQDDLISAMAQVADEDGEKLRADELLGFCKLFWIAGNETTTNLLSNGAVLLQNRRDLIDRILSDPACLPSFVEEVLRFDSPVNGLFRSATTDVEYKGKKIKKGDALWLLFASGNHDEEHFERPDEFIIDRHKNDHMAFGRGIHFCAGAALARLEGKIGFYALAKLMKTGDVYPDRGRRIPTPVLRGWVSMPMKLHGTSGD